MKIGLFGGSFNPIHNAHVALARTICEQARLDEIWFLVSPQNPLKQSSALLDEQLRLKMVELALRNEPKLKPSDYEFHLPRPSYTWNTLQNLKADFPQHTFYIIIGGDNWITFPRWRNHDDILREYPIIIYPREDSDIDAGNLPANVTLVNTPKINITSTMLREMIRSKQKIRTFIDTKVDDFITKNNLYAQ